MIWQMPRSAKTPKQTQRDPSCCSSPGSPAGFLELPHPWGSHAGRGRAAPQCRVGCSGCSFPRSHSPDECSLVLAQNEVRLCTRLTLNKCSHELAEHDIVQPGSQPRAASPGQDRCCRCVFLENGRPYGKYWKKPSSIYISKCFFS